MLNVIVKLIVNADLPGFKSAKNKQMTIETRTYADRREYRRAWYRSRKRAGLCYACTAPAAPGKILCLVCHDKRRRRERAEAKWPEDRETRRKSWQNMDWNLPNWRIAELMEVTESSVRKRRPKP